MNEKITKWAHGIALGEGAPKFLNNPGDLKFSPLTATWGATPGMKASDGGYLAQFKTYEEGFTALCNFLTLGCHNELKDFHQARTLQKFMQVYGGNPPQGYINTVAKFMGESLDVDISTFLEVPKNSPVTSTNSSLGKIQPETITHFHIACSA